MKLLILLTLMAVGMTVSAQDKPADYDRENWYVYLLELRDPAMATDGSLWTEEDYKVLGQHAQRFKDMMEAGTLVMAGPCDDGKGPGLVVFRAEHLQAAIEVMNSDPAVVSGLMSAELFPFSPSFVHPDPRNTAPPEPTEGAPQTQEGA